MLVGNSSSVRPTSRSRPTSNRSCRRERAGHDRHRHEEGQEKPHTHTFAAREVRGGRHSPQIPAETTSRQQRSGGRRGQWRRPGGGQERNGSAIPSVFYFFKAKPPAISFRQVVPLSKAGKAEPLAVDASRPVVVRLPMVKLVGHHQGRRGTVDRGDMGPRKIHEGGSSGPL